MLSYYSFARHSDGENSGKDTQSISVLFLRVNYNYLDEIFLNKCSESMHFESGTPVFEC